MEQQSIPIVTIGLEERSQSVLANALNKRVNRLCEFTDVQSARVALLDLDNSQATKLLNDFRIKNSTMPVIGISYKQTELPVNTFVAKPLNLEQLIAVIVKHAAPGSTQINNMITEDKIAKAMQALENKNIAKSLHKRAEDSKPKSAAGRALPMKTDEMCFDLERFLLGSLLNAQSQAVTNQKIAVLTCWKDKIIVIDINQSRISSDLNDNQIRSLAIAPIDDKLTSPIVAKFYNSGEVSSELDAILKLKNLRHFSQESFLWNLGVLTCRGRIPAEFTVSDRYYLRRWPNLTRANIPSNAMRIIAYWHRQPCSLMDIKEQLDIPLQEVLTIFSAAYAAGLTGEAKRRSDQILDVVDLGEHKRRGLMKSIIHRLRGDKSKSLSKSA